MPKRINTTTDMQILADAALRIHTHREIAVKYGVSPSYVSKLTTGKKKIDVYVPRVSGAIEPDTKDILRAIEAVPAMYTNEEMISFLEGEIQTHAVKIQFLNKLLHRVKGERNNDTNS